MFRTSLLWLALLGIACGAQAADIAKPRLPGDNDLLIKQYMDSRDPRYLQTMLATYAEADDAMLRDARRYAYLAPLAKNPGNPRPDMSKTIALALCEKYRCTPDPAKSAPFMQMMTASSGMWALDSLAKQDPQIKQILTDFLEENARLKQIYEREGLQFSNYTTLAVLASVQPGTLEAPLTAYEQLRPLDMQAVQQALEQKPVQP